MRYQRIVYCTDFSQNAQPAFDAALELASTFSARLYILHVLPAVVNPIQTGYPEDSQYDELKSFVVKIEERMEQEYGSRIPDAVDYEFVVLDGHVPTQIIGFLEQKEADLAVVGSYGLSGMELVVFGSVAQRVVRRAPCSVMIVRNPEDSSESSAAS